MTKRQLCELMLGAAEARTTEALAEYDKTQDFKKEDMGVEQALALFTASRVLAGIKYIYQAERDYWQTQLDNIGDEG